MCCKCKKREAEAGAKRCSYCKSARRAWYAKRREAKPSTECTMAHCRNPVVDGRRRCDECLEYYRQWLKSNPDKAKRYIASSNRARRERYPDDNKRRCKDRYYANKASGRCPCGNEPMPGCVTCEACNERGRARYAKDPDGFMVVCRAWRNANPHRLRMYERSRRALEVGAEGSVSLDEWESIKAKQRGRCSHCNRKTKLEMDHIVPLSRGGCNYAFNIQGLCRRCNASKNARIAPGTPLTLFYRVNAKTVSRATKN